MDSVSAPDGAAPLGPGPRPGGASDGRGHDPAVGTRVAGASVVGTLSTLWCLVDVWGRTWNRYQLDLAVYVLGAHHLADGRLYTVSLPVTPHLPFTYPPIAALAFVPLTALSRQSGQLVWAAVNVVCLYAVIALSLRAVVPGIDRTRLGLAAVWASGRRCCSSRCG